MSTPHGIKEDWHGRGRKALLAKELGRLARAHNRFDVEPPLEKLDADGFWRVRLNTVSSTWFAHPWRLSVDADAEHAQVAGGRVNRGDERAEVDGLEDLEVADGLRVWLRVKHYYALGAASEYGLGSGTGDWPDDAHSATAQISILPVAEIVGTEVVQYLFGDQFVPRIRPPRPDLVNPYMLMLVAGVERWVLPADCDAAAGSSGSA